MQDSFRKLTVASIFGKFLSVKGPIFLENGSSTGSGTYF